jgi:hypothetical protein
MEATFFCYTSIAGIDTLDLYMGLRLKLALFGRTCLVSIGGADEGCRGLKHMIGRPRLILDHHRLEPIDITVAVVNVRKMQSFFRFLDAERLDRLIFHQQL